jgi:ABC-type lipoprotein release transport system permease subunit
VTHSICSFFKIVGIFKTSNSVIDKSKSYVNILSAQQLLKEGNVYVTDINVNISNPDDAEKIATLIIVSENTVRFTDEDHPVHVTYVMWRR